jgi:hypothetical protein
MGSLMDHPSLLFVITAVLLWMASRGGALFRDVLLSPIAVVDEEHFSLILGATLTLLGLIIGFTFSMAVNRYDQRKSFEEQEANAIGTEYLRLKVLPQAEAAKAHALMREYLNQRIVFYTNRDPVILRECRVKASRLQSDLWAAVVPWAADQPNAVAALVLSGMNDVFNSEGYTEALWRNRVPVAAWILVIAIAVFSNFLVGFRSEANSSRLLIVLPIALSLSLFMIAEIDTPRSGVIRIHAQNLESLSSSLADGR